MIPGYEITFAEAWAQFHCAWAALVYILYITNDFMYAQYISSVTKLQPFRVANRAVGIYLISILGALSFIKNPLYIPVLLAGSWTGSFIAVTLEARRAERK